MWQRFTERARRVLFFGQEEAARFGESFVQPEHLLLGLLREPDSVAVRVLEGLGIGAGRVRMDVESQVERGRGVAGKDLEMAPSARSAVNSAYEEARRLGDGYIGSEHLLLGLIRQQDSLAARVLVRLGADLERARAEIKETHARDEETQQFFSSLQERLRNLIALRQELAREGAAGTIGGEWSYLDALRALATLAPEERSPASAAANAVLAVDLARATCQKCRHLRVTGDLTPEYAWAFLSLARVLKGTLAISKTSHREILAGKSLAMIFEKPSLRTRVSFETGMFQLGGHALNLQPAEISLGKRETVADAAHNLERMVDGIMARVFDHRTIEELAANSRVPVINGLSDLEHPCQALADLQTVWEKRGGIAGQKIAFVGDGNNVAHSLLLLAAKLGAHVAIATPEGYEPRAEVVAEARRDANGSGGSVQVTRDPREACADADAIYTDVWASMGQESEAAERASRFAPYQVNEELAALAKPDYIFMHCLPAHRGEEVTAAIVDGPNSVVFDQAENRLHAQKAVLAVLLG